MKTLKNSIQKIGMSTGLMTSLLLIAYFSLMKALNVAQHPELRYFNFFILFGGIYYAYWQFKEPEHNIDYLPGIGLGFITTIATVIPFVAFLFVYFSYVDPGLLEIIKNSSVVGDYLSPFSVVGIVGIEGLSSGVIISFMLMQYYKSGFEKNEHRWTKHKNHQFSE